MPRCRSTLQDRQVQAAPRRERARRRRQARLRGERHGVTRPSRSASTRGCRLSLESVPRAEARSNMTRRSAVLGPARRRPRALDRREHSCSQTTARPGKPPASCLSQLKFSNPHTCCGNRARPAGTRFPLIGWPAMGRTRSLNRCGTRFACTRKFRNPRETRRLRAASCVRPSRASVGPQACRLAVGRFSRTPKEALATWLPSLRAVMKA